MKSMMIERALILLLFIIDCHSQSIPTITEPRLTSIVPLNSTALSVNWQFASASIDQSDLILINIVFNEFYYSYNRTYSTVEYRFSAANKTITSLIRNFELVGAYYYICFSSNSSTTNATQYFVTRNECRLTRTCHRSNLFCPSPAMFSAQATETSSNSFLISLFWPIELPYSPINYTSIIVNNGQLGSLVSSTANNTYRIIQYRFSNLQLTTSYTVNASVFYSLPDQTIQANTSTLIVTTTSNSMKFSSESVFYYFLLLFIINNWLDR